MSEINKSLARRFRLKTNQGVAVVSVRANSVGGDIGMQPGDVVRQINQTVIKNEKNFKTAIVEAAGRESVLLLIQRGQKGYYVTLEP